MKYSIILNLDLLNRSSGIALNTVAHICAQLGAIAPDLKGGSFKDASEFNHSGIPIWGNAVLSANHERILSILEEAVQNESLKIVDYPQEGFTTRTDEEFRSQVGLKQKDQILYWGIAIYGDRKAVDTLTKGLSPWKYEFKK